jgi:Glyoxalase-like domain
VILGLDHLAIAVLDPDAAISELAAFLGLPPGVSGGRHPTWGTRNRLLWLGDTYIELVTVADRRLAERSWLGRATLRALPAAPKAIGWAISTDDLDLERAQMNADGASLAMPISGERRRPDGETVRWRLALPPEIDLERPFLIEHDVTAAEWTPDARATRAASPGRVLVIELPVDAIEGLPTSGVETTVGDQLVRAAGPAAGRPTVRIGGLDRGGVEAVLLGCRWLLE